MDATVRIALRIPNQQALKEILALVPQVHLDCGAPRRDMDGNFLLNLYGTPAEASKLGKTKYVVEVDDKYGEVLKARQAEVAQGDRFKGGTVKPVGLGIKKRPRL